MHLKQRSRKKSCQSKVWEDNTGTIQLAEAANKVTFWTKHIVTKYHFFYRHLNDGVKVQKVDTTQQLADVFTKGLHNISLKIDG